MIEKYDLEKLNNLPIEQVAEALGLRVRRHWSLCPFHQDKRPSLYFKRATNKYRCYVCNAYGGPIDLVMHMNRMGFYDACCWLAQSFGVLISEQYRPFANVTPREVRPVEKEEPVAFDPMRYVRHLSHPMMTEEASAFLFGCRKIDPRVVRWCQLSSTHTHLFIPYFDWEGHLQSVQWRYLGNDPKEPRFRFPKGSQCHIYNQQIVKLLRPNEELWIAEGCSDCWAMLSAGHKAIAIPSATLLKPEDVSLLASYSQHLGTSFHIWPDQDEPGEALYLQLRELCPGLVRHQLPEGCKDFAEYYMKTLSVKC